MQFVSKFSKLIFFVFIIVLTVRCNTDDRKPDNLLSEEKMVNILTDIHLIESDVNNMRITDADSNLAIYLYLETQLFKKYQIDTATYRNSYRYYIAQPEVFGKIYKQVLKVAEENSAKEKKRMNDASLKAQKKIEKPVLVKSVRSKLDSVKAMLNARYKSPTNAQKPMPVGK
jgi:hypothetical protein